MNYFANRMERLVDVWHTNLALEELFGCNADTTLLPGIIEDLEQQIDYERHKILDNEGH